MKKTIDNYVYDTDESEQMAQYSYNLTTSSDYYSENLYRTNEGRWFLCVIAAYNSIYSEIEDVKVDLSKNLVLCSEEKVIDLLIQCGCVEALNSYFPDSYQFNPYWPIGDGDYLQHI